MYSVMHVDADSGEQTRVYRRFKHFARFYDELKREFTVRGEVPKLPTRRHLAHISASDACRQTTDWLQAIEVECIVAIFFSV